MMPCGISRDAVLAEARQWIGTPFHHQAALRGIGCDCIGFVAGVARQIGVREAPQWFDDIRFRGYGREPDPMKLRAACAEYLDPVRIPELRVADIILFTFFKEPMHFGFLSACEPRRILHAYEPVGRVTENSLDAKWQRRVIGGYCFRGLV